ncbi:MAG: hypothetical protein CSA11_01995 [Chloroflexi bacterium]|nr:MAG: hypothetical protein CSA11_01995 [Chloroflexota bacterium]
MPIKLLNLLGMVPYWDFIPKKKAANEASRYEFLAFKSSRILAKGQRDDKLLTLGKWRSLGKR